VVDILCVTIHDYVNSCVANTWVCLSAVKRVGDKKVHRYFEFGLKLSL
jgi:hypothetical protein